MERDISLHAHGGMKHAINLIDYKDSVRKSIRYRPTAKRRPPRSPLVELGSHDDNGGECRSLLAVNSAKYGTSETTSLNVTFDDERPRSTSQRLPSAKRPKHILLKNQLQNDPNISNSLPQMSMCNDNRRGSLPPDAISTLLSESRRGSNQVEIKLPSILDEDIQRAWAERDSSATITSEHEFLAWIVGEIQQSTAGKGRPRQTSHFFNIVLGGNVHLVKNVLRYLKKFRLRDELTWVLGTAPEDNFVPCSPCVRILHIIMYMFWVILFFLLTPIFYTLHIMVYVAHLNTRGRMSLAINLPFVFAVLSEDPDMIQVFLDAGCPLDGVDSKGNNIYHYLADLSLDDPEKAVRCHLILCSCVENLTDLKILITEKTNHIGITALEAIAKYGSTHFLRFIMVDKSCIGSLRLSVSKDMLWADLSNEVFDIKSSDSNSTSTDRDDSDFNASLNVWEFDISSYEMGDVHGKQSYLLQLVASRSVEAMSEIDVWGFIQSKLLEKWISAKFNWYLPLSVMSHLMYLIITILLLVFVVQHGGDIDPTPLYSTFLRYDTQEFFTAGQTAINFNASANVNQTQWDNTCIGWEITWEDEIIELTVKYGIFVDNCSATALSKIKDSCVNMDPKAILDQTINNEVTMNVSSITRRTRPVRTTLDIIILSHVVLDLVIRQGFLWKNYNFNAHWLGYGIWPVLIRRFPGSYTEKQLSALMYAFYGGFLYSYNLWSLSRIRRFKKYRGYQDYIFSENRSSVEHLDLMRSLENELRDEDSLADITGNLVTVCLMLRFIHTIHALRLLPGIGFFVITTKKMAKHLLQFTVVFVIVSLAFATIFHFVMREEECPARKIDGFETLLTSLFSTYQVALGYGEYDFTSSLNTRIAYVAYTIISMLLLLNLIIAVMTTTAEELNQVPWKQALCCVERWDEILGTEITVLTFLSPFIAIFWKMQSLCESCKCRRRPVWENIKRTAKKTFEVTYLR